MNPPGNDLGMSRCDRSEVGESSSKGRFGRAWGAGNALRPLTCSASSPDRQLPPPQLHRWQRCFRPILAGVKLVEVPGCIRTRPA